MAKRKEHNRGDCFVAGLKIQQVESLVTEAMKGVDNMSYVRNKIRDAVDHLSKFKDVPRARTLAKRLRAIEKSAHEGRSTRGDLGRKLARASMSTNDLAHSYRVQYCDGSKRSGPGPFDVRPRKVSEQDLAKVIFGRRR